MKHQRRLETVLIQKDTQHDFSLLARQIAERIRSGKIQLKSERKKTA